MTVFTKV